MGSQESNKSEGSKIDMELRLSFKDEETEVNIHPQKIRWYLPKKLDHEPCSLLVAFVQAENLGIVLKEYGEPTRYYLGAEVGIKQAELMPWPKIIDDMMCPLAASCRREVRVGARSAFPHTTILVPTLKHSLFVFF